MGQTPTSPSTGLSPWSLSRVPGDPRSAFPGGWYGPSGSGLEREVEEVELAEAADLLGPARTPGHLLH